jgi:hypothetical protein
MDERQGGERGGDHASDAGATGTFDALPDEMVAAVLAHLACEERTTIAAAVSRRWRRLASDAALFGGSCLAEARGLRRTMRAWRCVAAADRGHLTCLVRARERGAPWEETVTELAAQNGHLGCLRYAHENGCPWSPYACNAAARMGHIEALDYALTHGAPRNVDAVYAFAARGGHLPCMARMCREDNDGKAEPGPWPWTMAGPAAESGSEAALARAIEQGATISPSTYVSAVLEGRLNIVRFLHERGYAWDEHTVDHAVSEGHLDILDYALANGCPHDIARTIKRAIRYRKTDVLRFLWETGRRWDPAKVCSKAAAMNCVRLARLAHEMGCTCKHGILGDADG